MSAKIIIHIEWNDLGMCMDTKKTFPRAELNSSFLIKEKYLQTFVTKSENVKIKKFLEHHGNRSHHPNISTKVLRIQEKEVRNTLIKEASKLIEMSNHVNQ